MDAQGIQERIYAGYVKAARFLGLDYRIYRPVDAEAPLGNLIATIKASFTTGFKYEKPNGYGTPTWTAMLDGSLTKAGDYCVRNGVTTYFIAAQQPLLPILAVECNRRVRLIRMPTESGVGATRYSGQCTAESVDMLGKAGLNGEFGTGWPASILLKGRSESTGTGLPATTKNVGWQILLPVSVPITIQSSDILIDDLGRRYAIHGAELTDLGWRLQAVEEHA
jgi:hypothetical protein